MTITAAVSQDSYEDGSTCVHAYKVLSRLQLSQSGLNKCDIFTYPMKHYIKQIVPECLTDSVLQN